MAELAPRLPLQGYALFQSRDVDEARERVARVFCPHRLDMIGRGQFDALHHHLPGERLSLNYISYGAKTLIAPGYLEKFYLLQIPLHGTAAIVNGGRYQSTPESAAVLNPHRPTTMLWEEGCAQVLVQIDRRALQDHLAAQIGTKAGGPLTFSGALDVSRGPGAALKRLVLHLVAEADAGSPPIGASGFLGRQMEAALMTGLLEAHCHSGSGALGQVRAPGGARVVRRAEDYMMARLSDPGTLEELAAEVGVGARALQLAFRAQRGTTPLSFWREARLAAAHRDLTRGDGPSVTEIALRYGFQHFGRFAESYRATYGCPPSETLRGARWGGYSG